MTALASLASPAALAPLAAFPAPTWGNCLKMRVFRLRPYLAESTVSRPINCS